jgi:hypothetical protein
MLRVRGLAALANIPRVLRLLAKRKVNPIATFFGRPIPGIGRVRRLFQRTS